MIDQSILKLVACSNVIIFAVCIITPVYEKSGIYIRGYCILNSLIGLTGVLLSKLSIHNNFLFYLLIWIELPLLILFYGQKLFFLRRNYFVIFILLYLIFILIFYFEQQNIIAAYSRFFEGIIVVIISLLFLHDELRKPRVLAIQKYSTFWFTVGILFYYGGTLLINLFSKVYMINNNTVFYRIWELHNLIYAAMIAIFLFAYFCYYKENKIIK